MLTVVLAILLAASLIAGIWMAADAADWKQKSADWERDADRWRASFNNENDRLCKAIAERDELQARLNKVANQLYGMIHIANNGVDTVEGK